MPFAQWLKRAAFVFPFMLMNGCGPDTSAPPAVQPQFGKPGGGGGAVSVKSTDPSSSRQGVTINVKVVGSGFDSGSQASFALGGVPTSKLVVNSTAYISATELVANVTIAPDADTLRYDVVVMTTTGKKGIGSELFAVIGDPPATWFIPLDATGLSLASDGKYPTSDGFSAYASGVCGVSSRIFATESGSNSGDATIHTGMPKHADRKCASYPRKITVRYPDNSTQTDFLNANLNVLQSSLYSIPIGATVTRGFNISTPRCGIIRFKAVDVTGAPIAGDSVLVTRLDGSTWDVQSQPAPNNRANCRDTGETFNMNIRFRVLSAWTLP